MRGMLEWDRMQQRQPTKRNQSGFSVVEVSLVLLVVAVLAATGFVVYLRQQSSSAKGDVPTTSVQTTTQPTTTTTYFDIKEWGVRAPYSGSLKLTYRMSAGDKSATFSADQLSALSSECAGRGGTIIRWAPTDKFSAGPPDAYTPTAEQAFAGKEPSAVPYAHIGNYYYTFAHDQAACGNIDTTTVIYSQTNNAVEALVANLQATPN
jgi:prepilin-type N-terminal cleavage/methylation domain-containing protein